MGPVIACFIFMISQLSSRFTSFSSKERCTNPNFLLGHRVAAFFSRTAADLTFFTGDHYLRTFSCSGEQLFAEEEAAK